MKQALIAASFGTSVPEALPAIEAVEAALAGAAPEMTCSRIFTSSIIRKILAGRGTGIESLEQALERLSSEGYERVAVQPTHLLYGIEYDKIQKTAEEYRGRFQQLLLGKPLVADEGDLCALAACVAESYRPREGALVLLGHGTSHFSNMIYPAFQTALRILGMENGYVGTVEGWPGFDEVLDQLRKSGTSKVKLAPLMLVAGEHAQKDMASPGPESFKSRLEREGFQVECHMDGLGLLPGVCQLYVRHLRELLSQDKAG